APTDARCDAPRTLPRDPRVASPSGYIDARLARCPVHGPAVAHVLCGNRVAARNLAEPRPGCRICGMDAGAITGHRDPGDDHHPHVGRTASPSAVRRHLSG